MKLNLSIIISTYNHAAPLQQCLDSLTKQIANQKSFEVIIVNNRSTDETPKVISQFAKNTSNFKSINEPKLGLSFARNTGAKYARGQYLSFIDADAIAPKHWVKNIINAISQKTYHIFGGPIYPYYTTHKPNWFKDSYETRTHGKKARQLQPNEYLSGSNFIIKKSLFNRLGKFDHSLGIKGKTRFVGEETAMQKKARLNKKIAIYYDPQLKVKHFVPAHKMTLFYQAKAYFLLGQSSQQQFNTFFLIGKVSISATSAIFKCLITPFRNKSIYSFYQNYLVEQIFPHFYWFGVVYKTILL